MKNANPTHAKEIALHFLERTNQPYEAKNVAKCVRMAKSLLLNYTKEDIKYVIDTVTKRRPDIYSIGYVASAMDDTLLDREREEDKAELLRQAQKVREEMETTVQNHREVTPLDESTERNRRKAKELGIQSGLRKKYDFDMFEKQ